MLYAFSVSKRLNYLLYQLRTPECCYAVWPNNIDHYLELLIHDQPSDIVGLRNSHDINLVTIKVSTLDTNHPDPFLDSNNPISKTITEQILSGALKSKYHFLEIPERFKAYELIKPVDQILTEFKYV